MKNITVNMLSSADMTKGQGVGSAYHELIDLLKSSKDIKVLINSHNNTDITHVHTVDPRFYFRLKKGVSVCYVHFLPETLDGSIKLPKIAFWVFKKYVTNFYNRAKHLVVVNPIFINDLINFGIPREKITYIPNYVSKDKFFKKKTSFREKYNIPEDKFVVLGVGQVQTRKGVLDFIKVAKKLPDIQFVWCGGFSFGKITDGYSELKKIVDNPPKNVIFTGIVDRDEMNDYYNMADVLFMPSFNELFPMSILEAVNSEKPLLLRDLELYHDILFDKYLPGKNVSDFVKNINDLKCDKKLYKKYSTLSKEIGDYYSKENVLSIWENYYHKLIK